MIKTNFVEDRIILAIYSGVVNMDDMNKMIQDNIPLMTKIVQEGGSYGVVQDFQNLEEMTPDAKQFFTEIIKQYKDVKQQISAIVFKDRHDPFLKWFQEIALKAQMSFSTYFIDQKRAIQYLRDKLKETSK